MSAKKKLTTLALALTLLPILLAGCGGKPASTDTSAQQQFLEERKGTPDPNYTPAPGGGLGDTQFIGGPGGRGAAGMPGMVGTVQKVDGRNITVTNPMSGTESTIHLADDAKVTTQAEATLADLKIGDNITAIGTLEGDILTANMVQLGGGAPGPMIMNAPMGPDNGGAINGDEPVQVPFPQGGDGSQPARPGMMAGVEMVNGTIEKIDGEALTINSLEGKTITVQTTTDTRLLKESEVDPTAIETGMTVLATGEQKGNTFEATSLRIMPAMQMVRP